MIKKVFIYTIILSLLLSLIPFQIVYAQNEGIAGYEKIAENSRYLMYYKKDLSDVAIVDKTTNRTWHSIPVDWEEDMSKGAPKMNLASHFVMETYNQDEKSFQYNTYAMSVRKNTYEYKQIDGGIRIDYILEAQEISISIEFILNDNGFTVRVPADSIKDDGEFKIYQIAVLPFLGASTKSDDGYLFVPDGSGSIIDFSDNHGNYREWVKPVYGFNRGITRLEQPIREESIRLPVFGAKVNDSAFIGVIDEGDYTASINAGISGNVYGYFRVYPSFIFRDLHRAVLFEGQAYSNEHPEHITERLVLQLSPNRLADDIVINYYLLEGEQANYSGMAGAYRSYLVNNGLTKRITDNIPFNLTLLGGLRMKKIILGLPFTVLEPLTTFKQAITILGELKAGGVDYINATFKGFNKGGYRYKITDKLRLEGKLGGKKALKNLANYASNNEVNLSLNAELLGVNKEGNGFKANKSASRFLSNAIAFQWTWNVITGKKLEGGQRTYLLSPTKLLSYLNTFTSSIRKFNIRNISFEYLGDIIYSDNNKKSMYNLERAGVIWEEALQKASDEFDSVTVSGGNAFTFPYASNIINAPLSHSDIDMASQPIPFYQMSIHGYIPYSGKPSNLRVDSKDGFLRMIEYGALPYYELMYRESSILKRSTYNQLNSGCYQDWLEQAGSEYKEISELYKDIYDQRMVSHEKLDEGVYKTTYENGVSIIVNYNEKKYRHDNTDIPAKGYIKKGGI